MAFKLKGPGMQCACRMPSNAAQRTQAAKGARANLWNSVRNGTCNGGRESGGRVRLADTATSNPTALSHLASAFQAGQGGEHFHSDDAMSVLRHRLQRHGSPQLAPRLLEHDASLALAGRAPR